MGINLDNAKRLFKTVLQPFYYTIGQTVLAAQRDRNMTTTNTSKHLFLEIVQNLSNRGRTVKCRMSV